MDDKDKISYSKEDLVREILEKDKDLKGSNIDEELIHELINGKVSKNINNTQDESLSFGQRTQEALLKTVQELKNKR